MLTENASPSILAAWLRHYASLYSDAEDKAKFHQAAEAIEHLQSELNRFERFIESVPTKQRSKELASVLNELQALKRSLL